MLAAPAGEHPGGRGVKPKFFGFLHGLGAVQVDEQDVREFEVEPDVGAGVLLPPLLYPALVTGRILDALPGQRGFAHFPLGVAAPAAALAVAGGVAQRHQVQSPAGVLQCSPLDSLKVV